MSIPKFLLGDHTEHPESIFVVHTQFPRFVVDLVTDEIGWLEDIGSTDDLELTNELASLIEDAAAFYDQEMERYSKEA